MAKDNKIKRHFFKELKEELKRVKWPTPKELFKSTVAVISIVLLIAVIVFALDTAFNLMNSQGINKLKRHIVDTVNKPAETTAVEGGEASTEPTIEATTEPTAETTVEATVETSTEVTPEQ